MPSTKPVISKPDKSWVTATKVNLQESDLNDYYSVRMLALPKTLNALGRCNEDKYNIYLWMQDNLK